MYVNCIDTNYYHYQGHIERIINLILCVRELLTLYCVCPNESEKVSEMYGGALKPSEV